MKKYIRSAQSTYRYKGPVYHEDYGNIDYISDTQNSDCYETEATSKRQALNFLRYRYIDLHTQYDPKRTRLIQLDPDCISKVDDTETTEFDNNNETVSDTENETNIDDNDLKYEQLKLF